MSRRNHKNIKISTGGRGVLRRCKEHSKTIYHVFDGLSRDRLERYIFSLTDDAFSRVVHQAAEGRDISEENLRSIASFCRYAFIGFVMQFFWNGMENDIDESVDMNASEVLKGFAMKQVYGYLDKDPEANLPNLLDMLEKYDKNGQAVTTQVEGIRAALSDPNNNWSKLVKSLWTDIDDEQRKKLVETVVINGTLIDDAFADEMLRVKNLVPAISIEGFEEATDFRRGEGTYRKVIEAMTRLKERKLLFGISCCYTNKNVEVIGSEEYFDSMIDMGAKFVWFFTYMPIGAAAVPELIATAEQRKFMYEQIHKFRKAKPLFTIDFWNDGDAVGGCIAGGRSYCHINANGDMEPCAFIHYSDSNIKEKTLLECYQSPLFMAYRRSQPFNDNMLRPCPVLDNPGRLTQIVEESGTRSTDLESPERACDYCNRCVPAAEKWAPVADELWNSLPKKKGVQLTGKMAKKA